MTYIKTSLHTTLSRHAAALVAYAAAQPAFAPTLFEAVRDLEPVHSDTSSTLTASPWLVPTDIEQAAARAYWLGTELALYGPDKEREARAILSAWTKEYQEPEDLVLGIVGLAVIGPTLGLVNKKKTKKRKARVVIADTIMAEGSKRMIDVSHTTLMALLSNELAHVDGSAYRLEPDMVDWLFADRETGMSHLPEAELNDIAAWCKDEALPHYALTSNDSVIALAVAPCVNEALILGEPLE